MLQRDPRDVSTWRRSHNSGALLGQLPRHGAVSRRRARNRADQRAQCLENAPGRFRKCDLAAPDAVTRAVDSIQSHTSSNPSSFSQYGALAALKGDQQPLADMREEFDMRRNYMFDRLSKISNVTAVKPQGAFYILVNISQLGLTSQNFADRLLSKANVAVVPGAAFGDDRTIRFSYATSLDIIKKGLDRFQDFCRTL